MGRKGKERQAPTFSLLDMLMKTAVRKNRKQNHGIPYESIESPWITTRLPRLHTPADSVRVSRHVK